MDIVIQARLSSRRLPSKVLKKVFDKSLIEYQIERLKKSKYNNNIIISTSNKESDDKLVYFCKNNNLKFYRGNLNNVSLRISKTIKKFNLKSFIRICGDSPLIDPKLLDKLINIYRTKKYDLVTNKFPRSFPIGQTIEIINAKTYLDSIYLINSKEEREHVTLHLYKNSKLFKIKNVKNKNNFSKTNHAIDTISQFIRFKKFIKNNKSLYKKISFKQLIQKY